MKTAVYEKDQALIESFEKEFTPGITILKRAKPMPTASKKVNVYVDGILTSMSEDLLNRLIDVGFYVVVTRKP